MSSETEGRCGREGAHVEQHAARPHDGLADKGGDSLRAFGKDLLLQLSGQTLGELLFALTRLGVAVVVRAADMQEAR